MSAAAREHAFELTGGRLCLDFANSVSDRNADQQDEHLRSYADLVSWSRQAGVVSERGARRLAREGRGRADDAADVLREAIGLREAIYGIYSAIAAGRRADAGDLARLNDALPTALSRLGLESQGDGYAWAWRREDAALDAVLWPVARSAAELLTSDELGRVRECAAGSCAWLFLDGSRNQSRRWCDMKVCGNRDKARRHYRRQRKDG